MITRAAGRPVYSLGEHLWWKFPVLRDLAAAAQTVDGTPQNADRLLARGELVLVLPGGLRESIKPSSLRYRLVWALADVGADDVFQLVGALATTRRS